jgi:dUTP pyrophosphatase
MTPLKVKKLVPEAQIPKRANHNDSGLDLVAISKSFDEYGNVVYGTGIAIQMPDGYEGQLRPRSSISKYGIALANSPATIDAGYRGELIVKFKPTQYFEGRDYSYADCYEVGDRICQLVIQQVEYPSIEVIEELEESTRGVGGFGSTGK